MHLSERFWSAVTYVTSWLLLSPVHPDGPNQVPIGGITEYGTEDGPSGYPIFKPPSGRPHGPGSKFRCEYPEMEGWRFCSEADDRSCWLTNGVEKFDIHTDYEKKWPKGVDRYYNLTVNDGWLNADGLNFTEAKLFSDQYPGPWIQACWGDTVHVNVTNNLKYNGTSIHWHGIRQYLNMQMDGVNGVTQCPIAPGDHFVYSFNVTQYGSSWYHSHYSVQYADGLQGPITMHGPVSAPFDEPKLPLIMTDWGHNSAFAAIYSSLLNPSILLNGKGNVTRFNGTKAKLEIPQPKTWTFEKKQPSTRAKRYILSLINTSYETAFIFSIDNHVLQVTGADFVPIHPYTDKFVFVDIGQRLNVIVEADPSGDSIPDDLNFWIRTRAAAGCARNLIDLTANTWPIDGYERTGILRYNEDSTSDPVSLEWPDAPLLCWNETFYPKYKPVVPWTIGQAANGKHGETFNITVGFQFRPEPYPLAGFGLQRNSTQPSLFTPLRVDYEEPTFFHLNDESESFPQNWMVIPEDHGPDDWVFLVLTGQSMGQYADATFNFTQAYNSHPIHLHGHDFAIVAREEYANWTNSDANWASLDLDNPPRRDVVTLPALGYTVIAFKTDNPGNWLMHCHIAFHASFGLGLQILERRRDADKLWPHGNSPALTAAERVCKNWSFFFNDCRNWSPGLEPTAQGGKKYKACNVYDVNTELFQDDSGI